MKDVKLPFYTIEELRDKAYGIIVGEPDPVQFGTVWLVSSRAVTARCWMLSVRSRDYEFQD